VDALFLATRQFSSHCRITIFALNEPRDLNFLKQWAQFANGHVHCVSSDHQRVEPIVIAALKRDLKPCVGSIGLEWHGFTNPVICNDDSSAAMQFVNYDSATSVQALVDTIEEDATVKLKFYNFATHSMETQELKMFLLNNNNNNVSTLKQKKQQNLNSSSVDIIHSIAAFKLIQKLQLSVVLDSQRNFNNIAKIQQLSKLYSVPSKYSLFTTSHETTLKNGMNCYCSAASAQNIENIDHDYYSTVMEQQHQDQVRKMQEEEERAQALQQQQQQTILGRLFSCCCACCCSGKCCSFMWWCTMGQLLTVAKQFKDDVYEEIASMRAANDEGEEDSQQQEQQELEGSCSDSSASKTASTTRQSRRNNRLLVSQPTRLLIMDKLLSLQQTDGSWEPLPQVCIILQVEKKLLLKGREQQNVTDWTTAVCLAVLRSKFKSAHGDWELMEARTLKYLQRRKCEHLVAEALEFLDKEISESIY